MSKVPASRQSRMMPMSRNDVADARGDERLLRRLGRGPPLVVVADEQEGAEAHALPGDVEQQEVVGEHQRQHRGDEEREDGVEPAVARFAVHVAERVDHHQHADEA